MNIKMTIVSLTMLLALFRSSSIQKDVTHQPTQIRPLQLMETKVLNTEMKDKLKKQSIYLEPYDKENEWTLNGISPESYYLNCGPLADCKTRKEHISIFAFNSGEDLERGFEDFIRQIEQGNVIVPIVWQNSNSLLLYWNGTDSGWIPAYEDNMNQALKGWKKFDDMHVVQEFAFH